jgi:hypothetical protein
MFQKGSEKTWIDHPKMGVGRGCLVAMILAALFWGVVALFLVICGCSRSNADDPWEHGRIQSYAVWMGDGGGPIEVFQVPIGYRFIMTDILAASRQRLRFAAGGETRCAVKVGFEEYGGGSPVVSLRSGVTWEEGETVLLYSTGFGETVTFSGYFQDLSLQ